MIFMKRNIYIWQSVGFIVSILVGTVLHFLYDWTKNSIIALFSAVNESTWEHIKLVFFPMLFYAIIESIFLGKEFENFWCIKTRGIIISFLSIPVLFYTFSGVFGATSGVFNIIIFIFAILAGFIYESKKLQNNNMPCKLTVLYIVTLCLISMAFFVFTFYPPKIPLFMDPIDGSYGLIY